MKLTEKLRELARRVDGNLPRRDDPDAFHEEKSEIVHELQSLAKEQQS